MRTKAKFGSPMGFEIVAIETKHFEGFHRALDSVSRERQFLAFLEAPPLDETKAFLANGLSSGHSRFVALAEGEVVGWCDITPKPRPVQQHVGLLGMGLVAAARSQGRGRALLEATIADAQMRGLSRIELTVFSDNLPAKRLYERVGFKVEGELKRDVLIDGIYKNSFCMALLG